MVSRTIALFLSLSFLSTSAAQDWSPFEAFTGTWLNVDDSTRGEFWRMGDDGLKGFGFEIDSATGDSMRNENLWVYAHSDSFYYVAEVEHNPQPTLFKLTGRGMSSFRFENPAHDFPKRIRYVFGQDGLSVTVDDGTDENGFTIRLRKVR